MDQQNRDKQIEEMAKLLRPHKICFNCRSSLNTDEKRDGGCYKPKNLECSLDRDILQDCDTLYNAGYRKASDVAREIVTEFANMLKCHSFYMSDEYGEVNELVVTVKAINEIEAELKKKYESEGKGNG